MTRAERRIVLAMLFGLSLLGTAGLCPGEAGHWINVVWILACGAQVGLLAAWAALRRQPLWARLSGGLRWFGWLVLAILLPVCYVSLAPMGATILLWLVSYLAGLFLLLLVLRRWRGWEIVLTEEAAPSEMGSRPQFTLRHLLLWLTEAALFLGLLLWLLREPPGAVSTRTAPLFQGLRALPLGGIYALLSLPMVMAALALVLQKRPRQRLAVAAVACLLLLPLAVFLIGGTSAPSGKIWWDILWGIGLVLLGYFVSLCLGLFVLRLCGYRLRRGRATPDATAESAGGSADRSPFRKLVVVLGLLYLAIPWPAWQLQGPRREQAAINRRLQPWQQPELTATPYQTGVAIHAYAQRSQELDKVVQLLADPQHADEVQMLNVSTLAWTDAAMSTIAQLKELRVLFLNGTQVTDAGLVHLYGLKHLEQVSLIGTKVTPDGIDQLHQALPDCQITPMPTPMPTPPPGR